MIRDKCDKHTYKKLAVFPSPTAMWQQIATKTLRADRAYHFLSLQTFPDLTSSFGTRGSENLG